MYEYCLLIVELYWGWSTRPLCVKERIKFPKSTVPGVEKQLEKYHT